MVTWGARPDERFCYCIGYYRADRAAINNCGRLASDLACSDNPAAMCVPKKGKYGGCPGTHIAK